MRWLIYLLLGSLAGAQQSGPPPDRLATVEGHVVNSVTGEPVWKAHVSLGLSSPQHASELVAITDETGRFRFADVNAGTYMLMAEKSGLLPGGYRQAGPDDDVTLLKISAGDRMQDLMMRLFPAGAISGRVVDADGDPVPGASVTLWTRKQRRKNTPYSPGEETTTNHDGEYRFEGLLAGTYYVGADAEALGSAVRQIPVDSTGKVTKIHELRTFFPNAMSLQDAQAVHIESGQEEAGTDIRMQRGPTPSVRGRIAGPVASGDELSADVEEGMGWTSEAAKILPNGDFVFEGLPPGKHRLELLNKGANGYREVGVTEISVVDQDITGVVITPFKPAQVRVRIVLEGEEDKPLMAGSVSLDPIEGNDSAATMQQQFEPQNGAYIFSAVPPGKYRVWFTNARGYYLKSLQSGAQPIQAEPIDIGDGAVLDLLMTFSKKVASVAGDVETTTHPPEPPIRVLLISENTALGSERLWPVRLDQSLHFSIGNMPPGKYLAFATQEDDFDAWDNPEFVKLLESEGTELDLQENGHASAHLKLIPKDATDRIRQQLGI